MAKYAVGDVVEVRSDLVENERYSMEGNNYVDTVVAEMMAQQGKKVTIDDVVTDVDDDVWYHIVEDEWNWTDDMFVSKKSTK